MVYSLQKAFPQKPRLLPDHFWQLPRKFYHVYEIVAKGTQVSELKKVDPLVTIELPYCSDRSFFTFLVYKFFQLFQHPLNALSKYSGASSPSLPGIVRGSSGSIGCFQNVWLPLPRPA